MLNSPVEEIKNRLDIIDVISPYLKLQKAGANWRALCPFHSEKSPSFFVSPARQVWRCFGCSAHGDMFSFIMQIEGVEFGDALRTLAAKAGVELKKASPWVMRLQTERKRLSEVAELATQFFEKQLSSSQAGREAKEYLMKRGASESSIAAWRLGYAPESSRGLIDFLLARGYKLDEISRTGLTAKTDQEIFDRFRSRIMFPVFDLNSQVIGFGGRIFENPKSKIQKQKDLAKYLNTFNTALYDKSRVLYGIDKAKLAIRQKDGAVLVEGYMDAILVAQAGFENVVAVSGTALTIFHLKVLKRYSEKLLLSFDMDPGGETATMRGIDLAIGEGFNVKVVGMPEGMDPADLVSKDPKEWEQSLEQAKSIFDFTFERALAKFDKRAPEGKKEIARAVLPLVRRIPNRIEQSHWISRLAAELQVKDESIEAELKKLPEEQGKGIEAEFLESEEKTRTQLLEERVLALLFRSPELFKTINESDYSFFSLKSQEILAGMQKAPSLDFAAFEKIFPEDTVEFLKHVSLRSEVEQWEGGEEIDISNEFKACMQQLKTIHFKEQLDKLSKEIKSAEELKDSSKIKELMAQFQMVSKYLHAT